ncbi:MAG: hypothetical protein NTZ33_06435 [Bacteroidetes bacterium]|nr:hypothetical protein [Bacteroidota bacterium]
MAVIVSFPENLCFSANVAPLVVATNVATAFVLKKNGIEILNEIYYPDDTGIFSVELKNIIDSLLSVDIPTNAAFIQCNAVATFTLFVDNLLVHTFVCVKSGVDGTPPLAINFFKSNFLTWQPQTLKVKYEETQYLTYYATQNIVVKLKFYYYQDNLIISQAATYGSYSGGKCYSFYMKYSYLRSKLIPATIKPLYIDVWVVNSIGSILSYVQRYQLQDNYDCFDDLFMFENSLGGIDVIRFDGLMQARDEHKISSAVFNGITKDYDLEYCRIYSKNTGYISSEAHRRWALDFFSSINRYHISEGLYRQFVLSKFDTKNSKGELNEFNFEFYYAEKLKYELYSRLTDLPAVDSDELVVAPVWVAPVIPTVPYSFGHSFSASFSSYNHSITIP